MAAPTGVFTGSEKAVLPFPHDDVVEMSRRNPGAGRSSDGRSSSFNRVLLSICLHFKFYLADACSAGLTVHGSRQKLGLQAEHVQLL